MKQVRNRKVWVCIICVAVIMAQIIPANLGVNMGLIAIAQATEKAVPYGYTPIYDIEDLYEIRSNPTGDYILMNDVDMSETCPGGEWDLGNGWLPIPEFKGTLNGNNYSIQNMNIFGEATGGAALIKDNYGTITNLHMVGVNIDVKHEVGEAASGLVNYSYPDSKIEKCSVEGNIRVDVENGSVWIGGISSRSLGQTNKLVRISECYNAIDIEVVSPVSEVDSMVGGLIGMCEGYVQVYDCYNIGTITFPEGAMIGNCAGIVAYAVKSGNYTYNNFCSLAECCNFTDGRICGWDAYASSNYCLTNSTFGYGGNEVLPKLMRYAATFDKLDFENIWEMSPGNIRPQLKNNPQLFIQEISVKEPVRNSKIYQNDKISADGGILSVRLNSGDTYEVKMEEEMFSGVDTSVIGKQELTITYENCQTSCEIEIMPIPVDSLQLSETSIVLERGTKEKLTCNISPSNATDKKIVWKTADAKIATVSSTGVLEGISSGTTTITATSNNGKTATCKVKVIVSATGITVDRQEVTLECGTSDKLTVKITPSDTTESIKVKNSNSSVCSADTEGNVKALLPGEAIITYSTDSGHTAVCVVKSIVSATAIKLNKATLLLNRGDEFALSAVLTPTNSTDDVTWKSSNTKVVTVTDGKVKAVGVGSATITAKTTSGKTTICEITVENHAKDLKLNTSMLDMEKGGLAYLAAITTPEDAQDAITWSSSDRTICSVDTTGKLLAKKPGTVTITAKTTNGLSATCQVTVYIPATSVTLNEKELNLTVGKRATLTASLLPVDTTEKVTWSSSDTSVATVSTDGIVTAKGSGSAIITALTNGGLEAKCSVTVTKPATAIALSATSKALYIGDSDSIKATLTPADTTDTITWTSSNTSVATVSDYGVVTALAAGTAIIKAETTSGKTATCTVTVTKKQVTVSTTWYFADVPTGAWYESSVEYCFGLGYINGTGKNTFSPNVQLTRGMMVTILWNIAGRPNAKQTRDYTDIKDTNAYYYKAVQWASENRVVSGFADGSFGPGKNITREQLACMIDNFASYQKVKNNKTADLSGFKDAASIGSYAVNAVKWAVANKIISGKNSGTLVDPKGNATRAEAASMIKSYAINVAGDNTIVKVTKEPIPFTITYVLNGGTNASGNPSSYTVNTGSITLKNPTKSGYSFGGWYLDKDFKTKVESISTGSTGNITLYAKWIVPNVSISSVNKGTYYSKLKVYINKVDGVSGYEIYRSTSSGGGYTLAGSISSQSVYYDENLQPGTTYYYKVRAYSYSGSNKVYGVFSSAVAGKTGLEPKFTAHVEQTGYRTYFPRLIVTNSGPLNVEIEKYGLFYPTGSDYSVRATLVGNNYESVGGMYVTPGVAKELKFELNSNWYVNRSSQLYFQFTYDGIRYHAIVDGTGVGIIGEIKS